jgi:excinuclease ABC subunit C
MEIKNFFIPKTAGCYLFKDNKDQIIYVGKSKFLPKRVTGYFQKNHKDEKTIKLVTEIHNVDFISTESENEALVLEEDLIKLYKPKFNIKGKDDRTLRSKLVLTGDEWKKLELFYPNDKFEGEVLCEFTSGKLAHDIYDSIYDIFQLPSCNYSLTQSNIEAGKFKSCLEWHIGRCSAPCVGLAKKIDHLMTIELIKDIFQFNFSTSEKFFNKKMLYHSSQFEYELAQNSKASISIIQNIKKELKPIMTIKNRNRCLEIKDLLQLKYTPHVIDAFDNSHLAGTHAVCGLVRFTLLEPDKSQWRKFNIKSGSGGDDYGSFKEVITRRFTRLINEKIQLPNLVIIDGARPQLSVVVEVLKSLDICDKLDVISISKNDRHQANTIHLTNNRNIDIKNFTEFAHILNEVHRFSLDFHRKKRSKKMLE